MSNLTVILKELTELHVTLLETAKKKQQILISAEINPLLSILAEESKLIKKIKEVDQKRITVLGEEAYKLSLSELIKTQPDGEEKEEWIEIHKQLQSLFQEIGQTNEANQQLLQKSLAFTQFMMEQMLPATEGSGIYNSTASTKEMKNNTRLFDTKA
jgi:flagellar biosynthesis/type III secretory pathway chaperone